MDLTLLLAIVAVCEDVSPLVRNEALIALCVFVKQNLNLFKEIAAEWKAEDMKGTQIVGKLWLCVCAMNVHGFGLV